jgi:hypothetical protein
MNTDWATAACREHDRELWFSTGRIHDHAAIEEFALSVCKGCPLTGVKGPCLAKAMTAEGSHNALMRAGVYGGLDPAYRWRLHKRGGRAANRYAAECGTLAGTRRHDAAGEPGCAQCLAAERKRVLARLKYAADAVAAA